ncbi:MAG: phospholipase D-like domain-containing protein [Pseudomonadota bacterium]
MRLIHYSRLITTLTLILSVILTGCATRVYTPPYRPDMFADQTPATIEGLYTALNQNFPQYRNVTYSTPRINYLPSNWIIQTPDAWGETISDYNDGLKPASGQQFNRDYQAPSCNSDADCHAGRKCTRANFAQTSLCLGPANNFQQRMYNLIANAKSFVDITTLQPTDKRQFTMTTDAFTTTLKNAIVALAYKSQTSTHPIYVRLLQGSFTPARDKDKDRARALKILVQNQHAYLVNIVKALPQNNKLVISIASQRSCAFMRPGNCGNINKQHSLYFSAAWNHGKIIDVDGKSLIVGGENLWGNDYLGKNPVNDMNIEITGPVAAGAVDYVNHLWQFVYIHQNKLRSNICHTYDYQTGRISKKCPDIFPTSNAQTASASGLPVKAMYVAKLNNGVLDKDADQSEFARVYAFGHAKQSIKISQQALIQKFDRRQLYPLYAVNGTVMQALAHAVKTGVTVDIVTSNLSPNQKGYSSEVGAQAIYDYLLHLLTAQFGLKESMAKAALRQYLHIKTVAYAANDRDASKTSSHNKMWIVDDHLFYVGSHNIYPSSLQQFGVIIDDQQATNLLEQQWWQPLWRNAVVANYHH